MVLGHLAYNSCSFSPWFVFCPTKYKLPIVHDNDNDNDNRDECGKWLCHLPRVLYNTSKRANREEITSNECCDQKIVFINIKIWWKRFDYINRQFDKIFDTIFGLNNRWIKKCLSPMWNTSHYISNWFSSI